MTATHDKEWIEVFRNEHYVYFKKVSSTQSYDEMFSLTLLDQIRRDAVEDYRNKIKCNHDIDLITCADCRKQIEQEAKKELLDEFKSFLDNYHNLENKFYAFRYTAEGKVAYYRYDGLLKQF